MVSMPNERGCSVAVKSSSKENRPLITTEISGTLSFLGSYKLNLINSS